MTNNTKELIARDVHWGAVMKKEISIEDFSPDLLSQNLILESVASSMLMNKQLVIDNLRIKCGKLMYELEGTLSSLNYITGRASFDKIEPVCRAQIHAIIESINHVLKGINQ